MRGTETPSKLNQSRDDERLDGHEATVEMVRSRPAIVSFLTFPTLVIPGRAQLARTRNPEAMATRFRIPAAQAPE